jgi:hypothetical protein
VVRGDEANHLGATIMVLTIRADLVAPYVEQEVAQAFGAR